MGNKQSKEGPTSKLGHDAIVWLKAKDPHPQFLKHVECVLKGEYDPIFCHPNFGLLLSGYLKSKNYRNRNIPHDVEKLCQLYLSQPRRGKPSLPRPGYARYVRYGKKTPRPVRNIVMYADELFDLCDDYWGYRSWPHNLV